jgi:hypothetical protein
MPYNHIRAAFVPTNSITQGEQVGILWPDLLRRNVKIHFAHREQRGARQGRRTLCDYWIYD